MSSRPAPRAPRLLAGGVVALTLAVGGCGVRLDTPPPPLPTPDATEAARQAGAIRSDEIAALAEAVPEPAREELTTIAADSRRHATALGGIWSPPEWAGTAAPSTTPEESPRDASTASSPSPQEPTAADVARAIASSARLTCGDAATLEVQPSGDDEASESRDTDPAGDVVTLLASICLAQRHQAAQLGEDPGELPGPEASVRQASLASSLAGSPGASGLARALDAAGYALEVAAARSSGTTGAPLAELARDHRELAGDVLDAAGLLGTSADPRRAAYSLGGTDALDPGAIEAEVLAAWTGVVASAPPAPRPAILAEMEATARLASDWGRAPSPFPGLPELS